MGNFKILKDVELKSGKKFWELFELDSFGFTTGMIIQLSSKFITEMLDKYEFVPKIESTLLHSDLTDEICRVLGVRSDMPAKEVLAFAYLLYKTPNLRFQEFYDSINAGVHCNTTLSYLEENDLPVPHQYFEGVKGIIGDNAVFNLCVSRHPNLKRVEMEEEDFDAWINNIQDKILIYIKGVNATKNLFN